MPIQSEAKLTGVDLKVKDTLEGHYDLEIDERPEELYEEFLNYDSDSTIEEAAAEFIDEKIHHIYDLAEERNIDPKDLDEERREAQQKNNSKVSISEVLDGAWEDTVAGTCRERAAALKLLYDELGIDAKYQSGSVEEGRYDGHAWVEIEMDTIADPSAEPTKVFQRDRGPHQAGRSIVRRSV